MLAVHAVAAVARRYPGQQIHMVVIKFVPEISQITEQSLCMVSIINYLHLKPIQGAEPTNTPRNLHHCRHHNLHILVYFVSFRISHCPLTAAAIDGVKPEKKRQPGLLSKDRFRPKLVRRSEEGRRRLQEQEDLRRQRIWEQQEYEEREEMKSRCLKGVHRSHSRSNCPSLLCVYCKKQGHIVAQCRERQVFGIPHLNYKFKLSRRHYGRYHQRGNG